MAGCMEEGGREVLADSLREGRESEWLGEGDNESLERGREEERGGGGCVGGRGREGGKMETREGGKEGNRHV